jgi:dynein heavy chain
VFNCSDQITAVMMNKLFSGLIQQGAWTCLDEFNRIDIEVLSVIAQQLLGIRIALKRRADEFEFEGKLMPLKKTMGVFITMNPGYAGRTELPDNLKSLFRPVSMMIPDYAMIAEIMLFAEGFENASELSKKMVQLYKLSSEQLSQQDHYDFGMRAVKSLLVMAGALKRADTKESEHVVLIRAMKDSNIPKFLKDDIPLFEALVQDLFPSVKIKEIRNDLLEENIADVLVKNKLQPTGKFITKVVQLFDIFNVRFGVMLVGQTGSGKTACYKMLAETMTKLKAKNIGDSRYQNVSHQILNPKSVSMGELYGFVDEMTQEWVDGIASQIIRQCNTPNIDDPKYDFDQKYWVVFDGPVDALWIENMNTVLDDNMTLCLANSERIKLRSQLRMLFEVQDLAVASPATVSRCGMVYLSSENLNWKEFVTSWFSKNCVEPTDTEAP